MDQQKQTKRVMTTRVSPAGYAHIRQRADEADVEISHMVRRMLAYASTNMPRDWVPPREGR